MRSPTCSTRTCATTRRCCRCSSTRNRRLHNGTIYRWNRPVYDVARGKPHLRVENRVLAAGPTVVDTMANAAFYYGLVRTLSELNEPISGQMSFATAEENFRTAARHGLAAELFLSLIHI